jgi:hypothetical protein
MEPFLYPYMEGDDFMPYLGAPARSRTRNLLIRSQALYPLSY